MNTEQVIIDDDNDSMDTVEILDEDTVTGRQSNNSATGIDTINLDEESQKTVTKYYIEIDGTCKTDNTDQSADPFANLLRNDRLMTRLIKKCLNMKNSDGMTRVIFKTLIPIYKDTDSSFKKSAQLRRVMKNTIRLLELDPDHKFSHIKSLSDLLQSKKYRKKVPFITLSSGLPGNNIASNVYHKNVTHTNRNGKRTDVIDLVNSDKDSIIILDSYEGDNDVIILDEQTDNGSPNPRCDNSNKENNDSEKASDKDLIHLGKGSPNVENNLLTPQKHEDFSDDRIIKQRMKIIEGQIVTYKNIIAELEEKEVTECSFSSPYLRCDKMKTKIVKLYEELCRLAGEDPVKRRVVRLQVAAGHPPGPVKRLQEFLNRNIDSTGSPPFPDFNDVVNCVQMANIEDGLGWSKAQVMQQALALFTQCGQALRKRRQKREWRDLMSLVKQEQPDRDPADEDPQLSARLEENKRHAQQKEHQILERYTQMEYVPTVSPSLNPRLGNIERQDPADDTIDTDSEPENVNVGSSSSGVNDCAVSRNHVENVSSNTNVAEATDIDSELPVQIKKEPVDIQRLLDGLGNDYTVTVFDIEDPFLVIEISSDSSYSDDNS